MCSTDIPVLALCTCLIVASIVTGSLITEVIILTQEHLNKKEGCCTPTSPEDFKNCVTQKRRSLPASSLGFKSISCQCHATLVTTEVRTQAKWVQTFRQCLLTDDEFKEEPLVKVENIFLACKHGNLVTVKHTIAKHPEKISEKSINKRTPGMVAALHGKTDVFNFLACRTCDWSGTDRDKNNILHLACIGGSLDIVNRVIRFADIDSRGLVGRTCVLLALREGHVHVADMLIKAGSNVTVVDDFENNLLHIACKSKSMKALRYIIAKGVLSLESRNSEGQTPLLLSVELGFIEGCKYLIAQGAAVATFDKHGKTILHCVMHVGKVNKKRIDIMRYFLSKGYVSKESKTLNKQQTPLLLAAWKGHLDLFKLLINEGCNTKAVDGRGDTILHLASDGGHYSMVKHILDKAYISPLARDSKGRTVLMSATHHGSIDIFKLLQRRGCNMTTLDDRGNSVLHVACSHGHVKMIKFILSRNELQVDMKGAHNYTPLMYAVRYGNVEAFKLMLRKGCSTKKTDDKGNTILHLACISGNREIVKLLIKLKLAQPFAQDKNANNQTPRQLAEAKGFDVIVNLLKGM